MTRLAVTIDFASAASWLAIAPLHALARQYSVEIEWRILSRAVAQRPPRSGPNADRGARHRDQRASYFEADLRRYARDRGVPVRDDLSYAYPAFDARHAAAALLFVTRNHPSAVSRYVDAVFALAFGAVGAVARPEQIATPQQMAALVVETTGESFEVIQSYLDTLAAPALAAHQQQLAESGISQAPTFDLGEERFIGRAHLPFLEWRLSGGRSTRPI